MEIGRALRFETVTRRSRWHWTCSEAPRAVPRAVLPAARRPPGYGKEPGVDAGSNAATPDGAQAIPPDGGATGDGSSAGTCSHAFRLDQHGDDSSVWLSGDFVDWAATPQQGAVAFTLGADSGWTVSYTFTAGPHLYKFILDGNNWILDPTNPDVVDDGMGNSNSRYICTP